MGYGKYNKKEQKIIRMISDSKTRIIYHQKRLDNMDKIVQEIFNKKTRFHKKKLEEYKHTIKICSKKLKKKYKPIK